MIFVCLFSKEDIILTDYLSCSGSKCNLQDSNNLDVPTGVTTLNTITTISFNSITCTHTHTQAIEVGLFWEILHIIQ